MAADTIPAQLADLRGLPLDGLDPDLVDEVIRRVLPEAAPVPVAAFQSSI